MWEYSMMDTILLNGEHLTLEDVVLQGGIYRAAEIRLPGTGIDRSVFVCPCCTEGK